MFDNIGGKLKGLARIIFILGCVGTGLMVLGCILGVGDTEGLIMGLIMGVVGVLASYLSVLFLYAFGELVENTEENKRINQQILLQLQRSNGSYSAPMAPAASAYTSPYAAPAAKPWFCSRCGSQNSGESSICAACGSTKSIY